MPVLPPVGQAVSQLLTAGLREPPLGCLNPELRRLREASQPLSPDFHICGIGTQLACPLYELLLGKVGERVELAIVEEVGLAQEFNTGAISKQTLPRAEPPKGTHSEMLATG